MDTAAMEKLRARRRVKREVTDDQRRQIKEAFELFDTDKDNHLDYHELKVALRALGFDAKKPEVLRILKQYDGSVADAAAARLGFDDFNEVAQEMMLSRDPHDELLRAFRLFADEQTGKISFRNLKRIARDLGEAISDEELRAMIDEFDRDQDGEISQEEFVSIMTGDIFD